MLLSYAAFSPKKNVQEFQVNHAAHYRQNLQQRLLTFNDLTKNNDCPFPSQIPPPLGGREKYELVGKQSV